jgi:transposase
MDVVYRRCCGLDVHKDSVSACVLVAEPTGRRRKELRRFGTMTRDLLELLDWLLELRVTHAAMESTGVYWKLVWNILEAHVEVLLANAQHIKVVPGRKTDTQDCEWIADLLQHGLLRGSFVPPEPIRDLRDLTRYRAILSQETTDVANRIQKVLEDANVKLGSVASDVLGVSGRAMLEAIVEGEQDPTHLAEMARHRLRKKIPELCVALEGRIRDHHRFLLKQLLDHLKFLEGKISEVERQVEKCMGPFEKAVTLCITIPGVDVVTAWSLVAETGADMAQFPSAQHLASWAGLCPGNNESAGKRKSGRTRKGSLWLRRALSQAAWAASRTKATYLAARYRRLAARRGAKRAIIAIAHNILLIAYYLLKTDRPYEDLGADYFDRLNAEGLKRYLVKRLERMGNQVVLIPTPATP